MKQKNLFADNPSSMLVIPSFINYDVILDCRKRSCWMVQMIHFECFRFPHCLMEMFLWWEVRIPEASCFYMASRCSALRTSAGRCTSCQSSNATSTTGKTRAGCPTRSLMKQEACDLIDNKDDKKMIQIMKKLKKILLTGLRKIEIRNK
jgi:hypothetical protein